MGLFSSKKTKTKTSGPTYVTKAQKELFNRVLDESERPFVKYNGKLLADYNPAQKRSYESVWQARGDWNPDIKFGQQLTGQAANDFTTTYEKYMNPHQDAVIDRLGTLATRNFTEKLLPSVRDQFIKSGQYGSSGPGGQSEFTARALRDQNESLQGQISETLERGYNKAADIYQNDAARKLEAAKTAGQFGELGQQLRYQDANALNAIGQFQQNRSDQALAKNRAEWDRWQNHEWNSLDKLAALTRGHNYGTTTTTPGPSTGQQILGGVLGGIGAIGGLFSEGGPVSVKKVKKTKPLSKRRRG